MAREQSEYREAVKGVGRDVPFTIWTVVKWGVPILVILMAVGWGLQAAGIITMNIRREVIQHSQQYVETKVTLLEKLHSDWLQLDAEIAELNADDGTGDIVRAKQAQQKSIVKRIITESSRIPQSQLPASIRSFLSIHTRRMP